jgi:lysophospholipase L1-like esterase
MKKYFLGICARPLALAVMARADVPINASTDVVPQFQNGDVVAFVGDSITHSRKFHSYIYTFYLTRFPERKIRFVNAGISGDSAGGALRRLDWDVLPHQPNVVSLMLGMNDVNRGLYGKAAPDEQNLKAREQALSNYRQNMTKLVEVLKEKLRPTFIFVTPSPYDQTVQVETENLFGVNEALEKCGVIVSELAKQNRSGVVDFHTPMTRLNLEQQKLDPKFTLIGADRVHPGDVGQLVMAYLYLKSQKVTPVVSEFVIDAQNQRATKQVNGTISNLKQEGNTLSFDCKENALPFPIEKAAQDALRLVPIESELNQQKLQVNIAGDGNYRLTVNNQPVGDYSAAALRAGINLAFNAQMPQFRQAQKVLARQEQRRQLETRLRSFAQVKIMLLNAGINAEDETAVQKYFADFLEKLPSNQPYFRGQFENYTKTKPMLDDIKARMEAITQELWQINQPATQRYQLTALN